MITPSRGCPYNCAYCAQRKLNGRHRAVRYRRPDEIVTEMNDKFDRYGIRDFAFYADYLLVNYPKCLMPILRAIKDHEPSFRLHAPEGFDTRTLCQSQELVDLLKAAHLQKVYLPLEQLDDQRLRQLNRKHASLDHFLRAVRMCERAGFKLRNMDINAFVLYGLPRETIDEVVRTILFVSEAVGSIIPMLFTPVPSTQVYDEWLPWFRERGWDRDLHMLNGKLYPFLEVNEGGVEDYIDLQRLMYTLNAHFRSKSFRVFGDTLVSRAFRTNLTNGFERQIRAATRAQV